jgi:hypothetical protein
MKVRRLVLALVAYFLLAQTAIGGPRYGSGRLAEWVPRFDPNISLSAAFGKNGLPIVIYNPEFGENFHEEYALFLLLRQDFVAYIVSDRLREDGYFSQPFDVSPPVELYDSKGKSPLSPSRPSPDRSKSQRLPFTTIPESDTYSDPILNGRSSQGLDYLAYRALDPGDRAKFLDTVEKAIITQQKLKALPSARRTFSSQDLRFLETPVCMALFKNEER